MGFYEIKKRTKYFLLDAADSKLNIPLFFSTSLPVISDSSNQYLLVTLNDILLHKFKFAKAQPEFIPVKSLKIKVGSELISF